MVSPNRCEFFKMNHSCSSDNNFALFQYPIVAKDSYHFHFILRAFNRQQREK